MRIIKFRAWYGKESRMLEWDDLQDGTEELERYFNNKMSDVSPAMQHTGTKDKNGKDIYEGDVLYHPMQGKREVYYPFMEHVASFGLRNVENAMAGALSDSHIYEIIGNIYENPELLGGK